MIESVSPRLQRIAALVLLGLVVLLAATLTVAPAVGFVRLEIDQRHLLLKEIATYRGLVGAEPELRGVLATIDAHPLWQRVYRESSSDAAGSTLQRDFRTLAEAQGVSLNTLQPLDPAEDKEFARIIIRVGFITTIDHLSQLLVAMQAAHHFMAFENLYVTSPMSQNGEGNAMLVVRGDVLALQLREQTQ